MRSTPRGWVLLQVDLGAGAYDNDVRKHLRCNNEPQHVNVIFLLFKKNGPTETRFLFYAIALQFEHV
jgi:hypothetical protein